MPGLALRILRHQNLAYHPELRFDSRTWDIYTRFPLHRVLHRACNFIVPQAQYAEAHSDVIYSASAMYLSTHTQEVCIFSVVCTTYVVCCIPMRPSTYYMYSIICTESTLLHLVIPTLPLHMHLQHTNTTLIK